MRVFIREDVKPILLQLVEDNNLSPTEMINKLIRDSQQEETKTNESKVQQG
ncbi:hypothetical protein KZY93_000664 [Vibrio vulnificus]|nr:hypothetical protein [Vibrio vulnificus]EHU9517341.1 hypothetical protein [Vibrio vulnificus]EJI1278258.1 hypothetical protein [Vibrio vulnificus]ELI0612282.1 hypothetical protein [Vibrio vulnificus]